MIVGEQEVARKEAEGINLHFAIASKRIPIAHIQPRSPSYKLLKYKPTKSYSFTLLLFVLGSNEKSHYVVHADIASCMTI